MEYKIGDKVKLIRDSQTWDSSTGGQCPNNVKIKNIITFLGLDEPFSGVIYSIKNTSIKIGDYSFSTSNSIIEVIENTYEIY